LLCARYAYKSGTWREHQPNAELVADPYM
jgi:hypothetical protein